MQNESTKYPCNKDRAESLQLLDRDFDKMTEAERVGLLKAFFQRAEDLKPMMMR